MQAYIESRSSDSGEEYYMDGMEHRMEELEDAKSYWAEHSWKMDALFALEGMKV
jgi:hypothetical protein